MSTVRCRSGVRARRWSKKEYYKLGELGFFRGQRVELIEGRIVVIERQTPAHATASVQAAIPLNAMFQPGYHVRPHLPLDLGRTTEPEPDIAVVSGRPQDYRQAHPASAVLIMEVSQSTLVYDRIEKGSLYARAGIADYWILNVLQRLLEVYRAPIPDSTQRYGHRYSSRTDLLPGSTVSPLALPNVTIAVADLLQ